MAARTSVPGVHAHLEADHTASTPPVVTAYADAEAAVTWAISADLGVSHVDENARIADNIEMLVRQAAGPIVAPAIEILEGLGRGGGWEPVRPEPAGLWHDLRPSEALELRELVDAAIVDAAAECGAVITAHLAAAASTFGDRHPDLPRGNWREPMSEGAGA